MSVPLLDGNVLVALSDDSHVHHEPARAWFAQQTGFATCPITQGTLLRMTLRLRSVANIAVAMEVLASFTRHSRHVFWADSLSYDAVALDRVIGHGQVTDAYLAALARDRSGRLATLDRGLAALHADVAILIES